MSCRGTAASSLRRYGLHTNPTLVWLSPAAILVTHDGLMFETNTYVVPIQAGNFVMLPGWT